MQIVDKVKVLYKEYDVIEESNLHDSAGDLYGQCCYMEQVIKLNPAAKSKQKESTLLHEVLHAIDEVYCIDLKEEQVEKLGSAIYQTMADNPEMFKQV